MRRRMGRRERHQKTRLCFMCVILLVVLLVAFVQVDKKLRPLIQNYGAQAARRVAMLSVHRGVEDVLSAQNDLYKDLISVSRGEKGEILSVVANVPAINLLKAKATDAVMHHMDTYENQTVRIPLGSLVGGSFFTGRGPFLSVNIHSSGSVITSLYSTFTDAGINQTCHRIYLKMTAMMSVLLPLERRSVETETEFLVCETVLVGEVPDSYTQLDFGENETLHKILTSND